MDVFISYRRTAGLLAETIRSGLKEKKVQVFLDTYEIRNNNFMNIINWGIEDSSNFILILSKDSFRDNDTNDIYRMEIETAISLDKNFIVIATRDYDPKMVNWDLESKAIKDKLENFNYTVFEFLRVSDEIDMIIDQLVDEIGNKWYYLPKDNSSYYATHEIKNEDTLWMRANFKVCKRMDNKLLSKLISSKSFKNNLLGRPTLYYFTLNAYSMGALLEKKNEIIRLIEKEYGVTVNVEIYGFCHEIVVRGKNTLEYINNIFGDNHFMDYCDEQSFREGFNAIMEKNNIDSFDFIEMTLVLKDCSNPSEVLSICQEKLNKHGGFFLIRELDDDLVCYHGENDDIILFDELMTMFLKDPSSGNRYLGKQLLDLLSNSYAQNIYISDETASTANLKHSEDGIVFFDAYFSYLLPEFEVLANEKKNNPRYQYCFQFMKSNYNKFKNIFRKKNFYFRCGYITSYAYYDEDEEDYD